MDYVPLKEAAKKHNVDEQVLTQLISAGMISAKKEAGEILVAVDKNGDGVPQTKEEIIDAEFAHLRGHSISASEASRKYSERYGTYISDKLFGRWANAGYITILERGYRLQMDESEVAYCAKIYVAKREQYGKKRMTGVTIFDADGNPYRLKYPEVAEKLRVKRGQLQQSSDK